jgi:hypothetical protein
MARMHQNNKTIFIILILIGLLVANSLTTVGSFSPKVSGNSKWYEEVQVYDMVALPPNDINRFHVTVNGLWNGFYSPENISSPFAFGRYLESIYSGKTYNTDEEFVTGQHEQGLLCPGTVLTTQGHRSFQGDLVEQYTCRSANGEMSQWDLEGAVFMCSNNPGWIEWIIEQGKKIIDADGDLIVLDEIQGNGFVVWFQFLSHYLNIKEPGFCQYCIGGFRNNLSEKYTSSELLDLYGIEDIETYNLTSRIAETMDLTYYDRIAADSLIKDYISFQEWNNYEAKVHAIEEMRNYAATQGKECVICANSFALGTPRSGDFWVKGLQFSEVLDFYCFENEYGAKSEVLLPRYPRNKWIAWEKLATVATNSSPVILLKAGAVQSIWENPFILLGKVNNYLAVHCAEAYSAGASFANWFVKPLDKWRKWRGCANIYKFVLENRELYESKSLIDSSVGVLYLYGEGMRDNSDSYLGLGQMLAESNIPYEVIFDGDGLYLKETLTLDKLNGFEVLLVPNVVDITNTQEMLLKNYVHNGGIAIVNDPEELGLLNVEGEQIYGDGYFYVMLEDKGYEYFYSYNDKYRKDVIDVVDSYIDRNIIIKNSNRKVVAYPYYQPEEDRMIIHLVNYDHRFLFDIIRPKIFVKIEIQKPSFNISKISVISSDFHNKRELNYSIEDNFVTFTVPILWIYDVVIIE